MNDILQLKGVLEAHRNSSRPGLPRLPKNTYVDSVHIKKLISDLEKVYQFWEYHTELDGALVSVHYRQVVAKSNRLKIILSENSKSPENSIRGARFDSEFTDNQIKHKHIFTYYVSMKAISLSLDFLKQAEKLVTSRFHRRITCDDTEIISKQNSFNCGDLSRSKFLSIIVDCFYTESFKIDTVEETDLTDNIVTIFDTGIDPALLLKKYGISISRGAILEKTTLRLDKEQSAALVGAAPYLISMACSDMNTLIKESFTEIESKSNIPEIPAPSNEPVIGVIDTLFNDKVYFSDWVEYKNMLDPTIEVDPIVDTMHGTAITSIIVDGPNINPALDDGCGRFKVRHFGVSLNKGFSSFSIIKSIRNVVASNRDIKVWNLSLGTVREVKDNYISPEAAELDRLQTEYDIIFIVAGTNVPKNMCGINDMRLGSPADSLNSIVVNATDISGMSASYSRRGPVLSFFNKPDVSCFGGDGVYPNEKIKVWTNDRNCSFVTGTSFAAPWITRKMAYLIYIMGFSREVAKAILIDAAAGWNRHDRYSSTLGYGSVPVRIDDILKTPKDEIRFIISGRTQEYETYSYKIPVPKVNEKYPFYARATISYFPECDRNQGVDYTKTELDLHFGRVKEDRNSYRIASIDDNKQAETDGRGILEEEARKLYRKWDNVKHISEDINKRPVPRVSYDKFMWGLSIKSKERSQAWDKHVINFGVVITLKEMNGVNRIDDFIKSCNAHGWIVSRVDVDKELSLFKKMDEDVNLE